jgi:hypothetical protein
MRFNRGNIMARLGSVGLLAAMLFAAEPCLAAPDLADAGSRQQRMSGFAGLNLRLPLGGAADAKPRARFQLTVAHSSADHRTGAFRTTRAPGMELGATGAGKPALFVSGQNMADAKNELGFKSTTATIVLVGVGVLAVLYVVAAATVPPQPDFDD